MAKCRQSAAVAKANYAGKKWECCGKKLGKRRVLACNVVTPALEAARARGVRGGYASKARKFLTPDLLDRPRSYRHDVMSHPSFDGLGRLRRKRRR